MLTQVEIADVARDLGREVKNRSYVERILAPDFVNEPQSWELLLEVIEVVLHRRGLYIASEAMLKQSPLRP